MAAKDELSEDCDTAQGAGSHEHKCPICLADYEDKSFVDVCFRIHYAFCYCCILQWSEVTNSCPLCKVPFKRLIHNVKSNTDYQIHEVNAPESKKKSQDINISEARRAVGLNRDSRMAQSNMLRQSRKPATEERRRTVYICGVRALPFVTQDNKIRVRDISAHFFKKNPAATHRLLPWLARDITVTLGRKHVEFITQLILSLIDKVDLDSPEFRTYLQPFFHEQTNHFLHELISFAKSPLDMPAYDNKVSYGLPQNKGTSTQVEENGETSTEQDTIHQRLFHELTSDSWDDDNVITMSTWDQQEEEPPVILLSSDDDDLNESGTQIRPKPLHQTNDISCASSSSFKVSHQSSDKGKGKGRASGTMRLKKICLSSNASSDDSCKRTESTSHLERADYTSDLSSSSCDRRREKDNLYRSKSRRRKSSDMDKHDDHHDQTVARYKHKRHHGRSDHTGKRSYKAKKKSHSKSHRHHRKHKDKLDHDIKSLSHNRLSDEIKSTDIHLADAKKELLTNLLCKERKTLLQRSLHEEMTGESLNLSTPPTDPLIDMNYPNDEGTNELLKELHQIQGAIMEGKHRVLDIAKRIELEQYSFSDESS